MKLGLAIGIVLSAWGQGGVSAFVLPARLSLVRVAPRRVSSTARSFGVDPSVLTDLHQHADSLRDAFSSMTLADAVDAVAPAVDAASVVDAADVGDAAAAATGSTNGWFGFLTMPIQGLVVIIHSILVGVGLSSNAWGISIVMLTVLIKALTFPLTKTQLESTNKMQALQPTIKELQAKYQSNPEVMNQKISEVYQTNEVNPLAGCLPSLVQIPVFIGLYRAVLNLASENRLDEAFLFLPNLEGPTYGADPTHGSDWIFQNWQDGVPSLGWDDTLAFLALPAALVVSQFVSMQLMQPKSDDPQQQQANFVLKLLPLMIGWFSLNVPAALCIYWFVNNIVTTATTLFVRSTMAPVGTSTSGGEASSAAASPMETSSVFAPPPIRDRPAGFGATMNTFDDDVDDSEVKPITSTAMDVEVVSKTMPSDAEDDDNDDAGTGMQSTGSSKKRGGGKKKKKKRKN